MKLIFTFLLFSSVVSASSYTCGRPISLEDELVRAQKDNNSFWVALVTIKSHEKLTKPFVEMKDPYGLASATNNLNFKTKIHIKVNKLLFGNEKVDLYFSSLAGDWRVRDRLAINKKLILYGTVIKKGTAKFAVSPSSNCDEPILDIKDDLVQGYIKIPEGTVGIPQKMTLDELEEFLSKYDPIKKKQGLWSWIKDLFE